LISLPNVSVESSLRAASVIGSLMGSSSFPIAAGHLSLVHRSLWVGCT
jgi:hypothetical protein